MFIGTSDPSPLERVTLAPDAATEGSLALGEPSDPISANGVGARSHAGPDAVSAKKSRYRRVSKGRGNFDALLNEGETWEVN